MTADADGTGKGLVDFFEYAASKGLINRSTAGSLRTASVRILGIDEDWETTNLETLDVDGLLRRFETLHKTDFTPRSLSVYKSRLRRGLALYQTYLENPSGFRAQRQQRSVPSRKPSERKDVSQRKADQSSTAPPVEPPDHNVVDYPFPLRQGVIVHLLLPPDLRRAEAKRLAAFIEALAMDAAPPRALPAPEKDEQAGESTTSGS